MKYEIRSRGSVGELCKEINAMIAEGWKPQGGMGVSAYTTDDSRGWHLHEEFFQAMMKEEDGTPDA